FANHYDLQLDGVLTLNPELSPGARHIAEVRDKLRQGHHSCLLTEPQFNVLTLIYAARGKPISSQVIQSGMIQRQSNVTRIVDKLVLRGWVTRDTCPGNRRKVDITITEDGREAYKNARKAVMSFHSHLMEKISNKDAEQLSKLLDVLRKE
ncbi:MAG: MarR family transcriptional regulator, partial [Spirochaetaceae bacterium]|nr:MarR family transcriptional regulator [Spirochaetaceae bacterium]